MKIPHLKLRKAALLGAVALPLLLAGPLWLPQTAHAAEGDTVAAPAPSLSQQVASADSTRAVAVAGVLAPAKYHYLGLEPSLRDGTVILTLALEPADDTDLRGALNFLVLTDDGLRRVLAGADPFDLDIASSAPLQFDKIGNKYQAIFKASGKGPYTVVVYNTGGKTGGYTLTATNAVLLDDANQVRVVTAAPAVTAAPTLEAATTPTETMAAMVAVSEASPLTAGAVNRPVTAAAPSVNALRLSGMLEPALNRAFFAVKPAVRDGNVNIEMVYEPRGRQTDGYVNFYVVDADGLRRFVYGAELEGEQLATGFPKPFQPNENDLIAQFTASGSDEYTVIPYSLSPLTVTYVMTVNGGQLIDRYGQTNEARAALAEFEALSAAAGPAEAVQAAALVTPAVPAPVTAPVTSTLPVTPAAVLPAGVAGGAAAQAIQPGQVLSPLGVATATPQAGMQEVATGGNGLVAVNRIDGDLPTPFSHNYWTLTPSVRDGVVILTMDYAPRGLQALDGYINFWVVDADGLRRIVAGSRPEDVALAAGSPVVYGPDKGKLQAAFQSSGRGEYAVIVYNDSTVPALYQITTTGGVLLEPAAGNTLVEALP